jgi:hypothetical protein
MGYTVPPPLSACIGVHRRQMYFLILSAFICGSILVFLGALGSLGGSIIVDS